MSYLVLYNIILLSIVSNLNSFHPPTTFFNKISQYFYFLLSISIFPYSNSSLFIVAKATPFKFSSFIIVLKYVFSLFITDNLNFRVADITESVENTWRIFFISWKSSAECWIAKLIMNTIFITVILY